MQSTTIQESVPSHTPEAIFNPNGKVTQSNRGIEGDRETCWFFKHDKDEPAGYPFNSDTFREGSD
jgi:hypothetical protein